MKMKKIINLLAIISLGIILNSCAPSERKWHESIAKIAGVGTRSVYVNKDGMVSVGGRAKDKTLIKHFDIMGNEILNLEEEINLNIDLNNPLSDPYHNPRSIKNQIFISDQRKDIVGKSDYSKYLKSF